ncbi:MAG: DedA family protein [Verrucomicrobiota bacterium]|jgi:membrane protein DedA with SNARE-associated domain
MHDLITHLISWYAASLETGGYPLVILLMAIESSIIPVPSELVIPFAAYQAHLHGNMSVVGVVIAGAVGSWIGATVMYWVSRVAGRPFVLRYGRYFFISADKVQQAENWASEYGVFGVFASRLLPVVRHLIGIPAGIVRLNFTQYSIQTVLGSAVWCAVLAAVGVVAGQDQQLINGDMKSITLWISGGVILIFALYYFFVHRQLKQKK